MSKPKKVVVTNFCGNIGKSSIALQLLMPRLGVKAENVFSVETINGGIGDDGVDAQTLKAKLFNEMVDAIMLADSAIVDVGASNVEEFFRKMELLEGSHEEFDYFVVPCTSDSHPQRETVKTVKALRALGVPYKKIKVVFNMVENIDDDISQIFPQVVALGKLKDAVVNTDAVIFHSDAFNKLKDMKLTVQGVLADDFDYRANLNAVRGTDQEEHYLQRIALRRLCSSVNKNLDNVYATLDL
ncbi:MAG: StbB family protein [Candidatus Saccharibacteria bacterium]|nr:StbB family protein [Candidatus Saccharibacteria bacterium]